MKTRKLLSHVLPEHVRTILFSLPALAIFLFGCLSMSTPELSRLGLMMAVGAATLMSGVQLSYRSPLLERNIAAWLRQMNWDGDATQLPFGALVPMTEWLLLLGMCLITSLYSGYGCALILCGWALARIVLLSPFAIRFAPNLWFGTVWLWAAAVMFFPEIWAFPVVTVAIVLALILEKRCLRTFATADFESPSFDFLMPVSSLNSREAAQLHPFSALRTECRDRVISWRNVAVIAATALWSTACIALFISELMDRTGARSQFEAESDHLLMTYGFHLGLFTIMLVATLAMYRPVVIWCPRLGPVSRVLVGKPVVWSYDRVLVPFMTMVLLMAMTHLFSAEYWLLKILIPELAGVLMILRFRPNIDEWQMTADSRLTGTSYESRATGPSRDLDKSL